MFVSTEDKVEEGGQNMLPVISNSNSNFVNGCVTAIMLGGIGLAAYAIKNKYDMSCKIGNYNINLVAPKQIPAKQIANK